MYGESGTSHTKDIHYYYVCGSRRKKICPCNMKSIKKQVIEDLVIKVIGQVLNSEQNIQFLTDEILKYHQKQAKDNTNLKLLEQHRKEVYKASQNLLKAIEQGIITDLTKTRLQQLENELIEIDIQITKEKYRDNSFLTKEDIEQYLRKQVFEDTQSIKIRKVLINTFVRAIYLYSDKVYILFNYTTPPEKPKYTFEENIETEKQITFALKTCFLKNCAHFRSGTKKNKLS